MPPPVASKAPVSVSAEVVKPIAVVYGPACAMIEAVTAPGGCRNATSAALLDGAVGSLLLARTPFEQGDSKVDGASSFVRSPREMER